MNTNKPLAVLLFLLIYNMLVAQKYINYTIKDGLPSNLIYRITQDKKGFIWIITDKGISKFDGDTFKNFTVKEGLPTNGIWNIRITPDDKVWYFSKSEALGYISNDSIYSFKAEDNKILYPTRIDQSGNKIAISQNQFYYILKDSFWRKLKLRLFQADSLYSDYKLLEIPGERVKLLRNDSIIHQFQKPNFGSKLFQLNDSLFVRNSDYDYEIYNLNSGKNYYKTYANVFKNTDELKNARFHLLNNQIQITGKNKLVILGKDYNWEKEFNIPAELNSQFSFLDKDGWVWVATFKNGLYKLPLNFDMVKTHFPGKSVSCIALIDNIFYVGVENEGTYKIINNKPELIISENQYLHQIIKIKDDIYFVFKDVIYVQSGKIFKHKKRSSEFVFGKQLVEHGDDIFSLGYLHIFQNDYKEFLTKKTFKEANYTGLFSQNDTLFSTGDKNMFFYDKDKNQFYKYKNVSFSGSVRCTITNDNSTFISVKNEGIYRFKGGYLTKLIKEDKNAIGCLRLDNNKQAYGISSDALIKYQLEGSQCNKVSVLRLSDHQINGLRTYAIHNDSIYFGTTNGLMAKGLSDTEQQKMMHPYIKEIKLNNDPLNPNNAVKLHYKSNQQIKVDFGAINYANIRNLEFKYQLQPLNDSWITTKAGEVNLSNLAPNDYVLHLQVKQNHQIKDIQLPIIIIPKWWQRKQYQFIGILILLIGSLLLVRYFVKRSQRAKHQKLLSEKRLAQLQLKALRSQMNPHFVFNSLSAIQYYINNNDNATSEKYLVKFSKLIRRFFELSKQQTITVNEEVDLLKTYLDLEKLRFKEKLTYNINKDENLTSMNFKIPTMLLQPIVENAINHGIFNKESIGNVDIDFQALNKTSIQIDIKDDGVGFKQTQKRNKKLKSSNLLKERLEYLNSTGLWQIHYYTKEQFPLLNDKGNISTFIIHKL